MKQKIIFFYIYVKLVDCDKKETPEEEFRLINVMWKNSSFFDEVLGSEDVKL